jgi:uncharacterized UBP type Zn finger protein
MPKEKNVYCHNCDDHDRSENNAVRNFSHTLGVALSGLSGNQHSGANFESCMGIVSAGLYGT